MLQLLPQSEVLKANSTTASDAVNYINTYIDKHSCKNMSVDISFMNILDACHVSTLCSAKHYVKYPDGKINWKISSEMVREFNSSLELGNAEYELL